LQVKGTGIKWYSVETGGTALLNGDALTSGLYYAAQSTDLCESAMRTAVNVVIDNTLVLDSPDITTPQRFCPTATLADVAVSAGINPANIAWYAVNTGGTRLDPATIISASGTYYAAQVAGNCESAERTAVTITIGSTPPTVPIIETPQSFCFGATIRNIDVPNNQIRWYAALTGGSQLPSNTILETKTYYATQGAGGCESSPRIPIQTKINVVCLTFCGGRGTATAPYQICTVEDLEALANFVNDGYGDATAGIYYKLMNDLDLSGYSNWEPIGNSHAFQGNFNGNNHTISNLTIDRASESNIGLFGYINNGTVQNLGIVDCDIKGTVGVGSLVGTANNATLSNCYASGSVNGEWFVGGLVGSNDDHATITNCYATGNVTGGSFVGGLAGYNNDNSAITNAYATGNVTGDNFVGGLAGNNNDNSAIANCFATGNVTSTVGSNAGGIAGMQDNGSAITNSYCYEDALINGVLQKDIAPDDIHGTSIEMLTLKSFLFYNTVSNWNGGAWDIADDANPAKIWRICDGNSLPYFQWQQEKICIITHTITPTAGANGNISPSVPQTVNHGTNLTFTFIPNVGYVVDSIYVDNEIGRTHV
jgi:hypothetical protein